MRRPYILKAMQQGGMSRPYVSPEDVARVATSAEKRNAREALDLTRMGGWEFVSVIVSLLAFAAMAVGVYFWRDRVNKWVKIGAYIGIGLLMVVHIVANYYRRAMWMFVVALAIMMSLVIAMGMTEVRDTQALFMLGGCIVLGVVTGLRVAYIEVFIQHQRALAVAMRGKDMLDVYDHAAKSGDTLLNAAAKLSPNRKVVQHVFQNRENKYGRPNVVVEGGRSGSVTSMLSNFTPVT